MSRIAGCLQSFRDYVGLMPEEDEMPTKNPYRDPVYGGMPDAIRGTILAEKWLMDNGYKPMVCSKRFENELGNTIRFVAVHDQRGVTVSATGPTSEVEHTWTLREAEELSDLLLKVLRKD